MASGTSIRGSCGFKFIKAVDQLFQDYLHNESSAPLDGILWCYLSSSGLIGLPSHPRARYPSQQARPRNKRWIWEIVSLLVVRKRSS